MADVKTLEIYPSILRYINAIRQYFEIDSVFLFGSYATGAESSDSDIDLAIVSSSFSDNRFNDNVILGKLTWGIDTRIEPIGFTPEEFQARFLAQEIRTKGLEVPFN
ncbi:MAG: nucleotidyltransferase domain-containing protein [Ignavibacteria bacterium]|nr:nucleotidyltransferase domain-containing protein [Ignavibacteria bacterium]